MQSRILIALIAPVLLTGCLAQSQIQGKYMSSQEDCRSETARAVKGGETVRPVTETQASPIAQRFSDCMTKEGWHLSTPKPGTQVASNPPTGSPSTNPSAALATGSTFPRTVNGPPASAYPPASSYPVYYPPSGAPSVNPSAAAARQQAAAGAYAAPRNAITGSPNAMAGGTAPMVSSAPSAPIYPPSGAPSVNPSAAAARAPATAATASSPTVTNTATSAATNAATSTATKAATNAATNAVQTNIPASPDTATYQPARPATQATPAYGTGPGRQF